MVTAVAPVSRLGPLLVIASLFLGAACGSSEQGSVPQWMVNDPTPVPLQVVVLESEGAAFAQASYPAELGGAPVTLWRVDAQTLAVLIPQVPPGAVVLRAEPDGEAYQALALEIQSAEPIADPTAYVGAWLDDGDARLSDLLVELPELGAYVDPARTMVAGLREAMATASEADRALVAGILAANPGLSSSGIAASYASELEGLIAQWDEAYQRILLARGIELSMEMFDNHRAFFAAVLGVGVAELAASSSRIGTVHTAVLSIAQADPRPLELNSLEAGTVPLRAFVRSYGEEDLDSPNDLVRYMAQNHRALEDAWDEVFSSFLPGQGPPILRLAPSWTWEEEIGYDVAFVATSLDRGDVQFVEQEDDTPLVTFCGPSSACVPLFQFDLLHIDPVANLFQVTVSAELDCSCRPRGEWEVESWAVLPGSTPGAPCLPEGVDPVGWPVAFDAEGLWIGSALWAQNPELVCTSSFDESTCTRTHTCPRRPFSDGRTEGSFQYRIDFGPQVANGIHDYTAAVWTETVTSFHADYPDDPAFSYTCHREMRLRKQPNECPATR